MKRGALAVSILLLAGAVVLLFLPVLECPDCLGAERPSEVRPAGRIPLGCPRCGDAGKVGVLSRWIRRRLDPRLTALIQATRGGVENLEYQAVPILDSLGDGSGEPFVVGEFGYADACFLDDGEERLLAAYVYSSPRFSSPNRWKVALFAPDGSILDRVEVLGSFATGKVSPDWDQSGSGRRCFRLLADKSDPCIFRVVGDSGETRQVTTELRVHARRGRFEVEAVP